MVVEMQVRPRSDDEEAERVRAVEELQPLAGRRQNRVDRITRLAQRVFDVSSAAVTLVDDVTQHVVSQQGAPLKAVPREVSFCNNTVAQRRTQVVEDATADDRYADNPLVLGEPHIRFYAGHQLHAAGGEAVGALCLVDPRPRRFTESERALLEELAEWVSSELTRSAELHEAAQVQRALMPRSTPTLPGFTVAGVCLPSGGVGGDFFDWYTTPDGDLVLTLADVMGKGMPAAIIMATVRGVMRLAGAVSTPADAVRDAARTLHEDLERTGSLVTLGHARLSPDGRLRYANAGHGLMLWLRADGQVVRPPGGGLPVGVLQDDEWPEDDLVVEPGDLVLAFSDGLLDLYDGTLDALDEIVRVARSASDAPDVVARFRDLAESRGTLLDDVTVVAIRREP